MEKSRSVGTARLVLMVIATHADKDTLTTFLGEDLLAEETNMPKRTLQFNIAKLKESGELQIRGGKGRGIVNNYTITLSEKGATHCALSEEEKAQDSVENPQPIASFEEAKRRKILQEKAQDLTQKAQDLTEKAQPIAPLPVEPKEPEETKKKNIPSPLARLEMDLPDWLSRESWGLWLKHRREIKHPVTETQADALIKVLGKFRARGMPPEEVIEQSIAGGWQGLFELKGGENGNQRNGRTGHGKQPNDLAPAGQRPDTGVYQQRAVKNRI
jgi:hypothetical protein